MHTVPSARELLSRAANADIASVGLLFESHRAGLLAHVLSILGYDGATEAEDLVQETFLQALNRLAQLESPDAFRWWLHTILRNLCYQHLRRKRRHEPLEAALQVPTPSTVEDDLIVDCIRDEVWAALERLPANLQAALLLRHFGANRSYGEIAAILGVPVGTIRSRLHQARASLAAALRQAANRDGGGLLRRLDQQAEQLRESFLSFYNHGSRDLLRLFAEDLLVRYTDEAPLRGRVHIEADFGGDVAAGVRLDAVNVVHSGSVSVLEGRLINPPDDPFHCPPAATLVAFYSGPQAQHIAKLHIYLAPRLPDYPVNGS